MLYRRFVQKTKVFLVMACLALAACARATAPFPVTDEEQAQDDHMLRMMYETRAADMNAIQPDTATDYNHTKDRTGAKDYLKNKEFRLNMVGYRILTAAYPLCPEKRKSRSMMMGVSGQSTAYPVVDWAITPFGQADNATLKMNDEILDMGGEVIPAGMSGLLRARAVMADYANRMTALRITVRREDRRTQETHILNITQQPQRFCNYDFVLDKDDSYNAYADDKTVHVNTGVFNYLATDDELAFVLGHETSHNIMRHGPKKRWYRVLHFFTQIPMYPVTVLEGSDDDVANNLTVQGFSRNVEDEADYIGVYLAAAAGYDPEGALSAAEILADIQHTYITGNGDEDPSDTWVQHSPKTAEANHPPGGERYTQLKKAVDQIKQKQAQGLPLLPEFLD